MTTLVPKISITNKIGRNIDLKVIEFEQIKYSIMEISPSRMTSNRDVKWLIAEFSRLFKPLSERISISGGKVIISPELTIWWEVMIHKGEIKFYLVIPDKNNIKDTIKRQVMKTWKQANVREVTDHMPEFTIDNTDVTKLTLKYNSILSLDSHNPHYSPLDSLLNAKHYLKDDDVALLQIGMKPEGNEWNKTSQTMLESIKKGKAPVPRKKGKIFTKGELFQKVLRVIGFIAEELVNLIGDFIIPGWEDDHTFSESTKHEYGEVSPNNRSTNEKVRSDAFKIDIRVVARSEDVERRKSIIRAMSSGFDPLEGDNKLIETPIQRVSRKEKELKKIQERKMTVKMNGDVLCSLELSKIINVPDQKAQIEHYNELSLVSHRGETEVPRDIFKKDGIPFAQYEDTDGEMKSVYFTSSDKNLLCMPRVIIGEPGTGKTTFAQNFALHAFNQGYGVFMIDAADGKMVQRVMNRIRPDQRDKVKIIDFMNTEYPVGLGWNEIFRGRNMDVIEDLVVEEIVGYVELVAGTDLNMRARTWVESAVKAVFTTPDATLQDVENMLNNAQFRAKVIPTIEDPELRSDWEYYHNKLKAEERKTIYDEAFRRLSPVMRKKALKNFILQRPKKDSLGNYLFDIRKWMDEGYMVLVKANETLGETLQTALVSFMISKFNLSMISREDVDDEDDRKPCFLLLDEPDHYIRGSERWRNMLTRYRKYRCGLVFMFHGWQQLKETDRDLPKIIRKAGPHYVVFQTDEDNLLELKSVIEPDFRIKDIAKGMPQHHAVIKLKMFSKDGEPVPAFMAKALGRTEDLFDSYNNNDLYEICAKELGRPKKEVMEELFAYKTGSEFDISQLMQEITPDGEGDLDLDSVDEGEDVEEKNRVARDIIEHEVSNFIQSQIDKGEDPDYDLLEHMDELLDGDSND